MVTGSGIVVSMIVFAVGAVLDFALTVSPNQHGFNVHTVGIILMAVGAVGAVIWIVAAVSSGSRRSRTVVDSGGGRIVEQENMHL